MLYCSSIPVKNTFVHFTFLDWGANHRSRSAPPVLSSCCVASAKVWRKRKKKALTVARKRAACVDEAVALREFAAHAHEERWAAWAALLLSRRRAIAWRWTRTARAMREKSLRPVLRATLRGNAFKHVLQYGMRPLDLIHFHRASVLRAVGASFEIWASDAIAQATKVRNLTKAAEYFSALASRRVVMIHLPNRHVILLRWEHDFPIGALQGKVFFECGILPERQIFRCSGRHVRGDTLGRAGVTPGDVIDVVELG